MNFYTKKRRPPVINIVSLIDVLAILLIFFIVTTTFKKKQPQLEIALPQSATAAEAATTRSPVLVSVDSAEEVYVGDRPVPLSGLRAAVEELLRATPETEFGLQVDKAVPFQTVVKVLDALKEAGVENLPAFTEKTE